MPNNSNSLNLLIPENLDSYTEKINALTAALEKLYDTMILFDELSDAP